MSIPTPQEVVNLLAECFKSDYDYWLDYEEAEWAEWVAEGGDASMDQATEEEEDRGRRQSHLI